MTIRSTLESDTGLMLGTSALIVGLLGLAFLAAAWIEPIAQMVPWTLQSAHVRITSLSDCRSGAACVNTPQIGPLSFLDFPAHRWGPIDAGAVLYDGVVVSRTPMLPVSVGPPRPNLDFTTRIKICKLDLSGARLRCVEKVSSSGNRVVFWVGPEWLRPFAVLAPTLAPASFLLGLASLVVYARANLRSRPDP